MTNKKPKPRRKPRLIFTTKDFKPLSRIHSSEPMTLGEIAEVMNITRERVRQIEVKALAKLKRELSKRGFNPDDLLGQLNYDDTEPTMRPRVNKRGTND